MKIPNQALSETIGLQVGRLAWTCLKLRTTLSHIKAHGALYNLAAADAQYADTLLNGLKGYESIPIYAPWNSQLATRALAEGFKVIYEAFADRAYNADGSLVPRSTANSVLLDPELALAQVESIHKRKCIVSVDGTEIDMTADTFCIHGDNPSAVLILQVLKAHRF